MLNPQRATPPHLVPHHRSPLGVLLAPSLLLALPPAGCGDDDAGNQNENAVHLSGDSLRANNQPADFTCFDATDPAMAFSVDTEVSGIVQDFEDKTAVSGIEVSIYADRADLLADQPFDVSAPSDENGHFSVNAPGGVARVHWKMHDPAGKEFHFDTLEMEDPIGGYPPGPPPTTGADRLIISAATVESVPISLGIGRIEGRGQVAGTLYDCRHQHVEHGAVRVYDGPPDDPTRAQLSAYAGNDLNTFYFYSGMPSRLQHYTDPEGQFLTANLVPGGSVWVEAWGRLDPSQLPADHADCTEGCLVAVQEVPVLSDAIVIIDVNPTYAQP